MIRYRLVCDAGHDFETWFRSSTDCDEQLETGLVSCPTCGSDTLEKALMAPSLQTARKKTARAEANQPVPRETVAAIPKHAMSPEAKEALAMMRHLRKKIVDSAENVGDRFAEEARKIHFKEAEERGIYGQATREEVKDLVDDGIGVLPMPELPEDRN